MREKIMRIIDANINRATEGLRVAEDVVRFVLDDAKLTSRLKDIRHELVKLVDRLGASKRVTLSVRDVRRDVGAWRSTKSEGRRKNILDVFLANIKRAEESVRVFEETSKLFDPKLGPKFKKLRFELYDIEQKASILLKKKIKLDSPLYVITDDSFGYSHLYIMKEAAKAGARIFQLRDKRSGTRDKVKTAKRMADYARAHGLTFLVNDSPDIAIKADADGVHLGIGEVGNRGYGLGIRELREKGKIIGISASNLKEALRAQALRADYIGFGPVFSTPIKPGMKPTGIKELRKVMKRVTIPVVAIGGINRSNIAQIKVAGCDRVAVIRAVAGAKNIKRTTIELIKAINYKSQ